MEAAQLLLVAADATMRRMFRVGYISYI